MTAMWKRRLLSALIAIPLALVIAQSEAEGPALYAMVSLVSLIALAGGALGAERLKSRRHRAQS
jgi:hypothetical protein